MASKKNVSTATVREWARENIALIPEEGHKCLGETARGRLHPVVREAFEKANRGKAYAEKVAESNTVTVPVVMLDKAGRKTTRQVTVTTAEAREAIGAVGRKGRISMALVHEALSAMEADKVAGEFTKAPKATAKPKKAAQPA